MSELDQIWADLLDEASLKAVDDGRSHVADFLRLKLANDTIRRTGIEWLLGTTIGLAGQAQQRYSNLRIDRISPHSFKIGMSTMVGSMVEINYGVRSLAVEAGWTRTPSDGIMPNGGLALARAKHFGMQSADATYRLIRGNALPMWIDELDKKLRADDLTRHLQLVLAE